MDGSTGWAYLASHGREDNLQTLNSPAYSYPKTATIYHPPPRLHIYTKSNKNRDGQI